MYILHIIKILLDIFAMSCNHFFIFGKYLSDMSFTCSFALSIMAELSSDFFTLFRKPIQQPKQEGNYTDASDMKYASVQNLTNSIITRSQCDCHGVRDRVNYAIFSAPCVFIAPFHLDGHFSSRIRRRQFRSVRREDIIIFLSFGNEKLFRGGD